MGRTQGDLAAGGPVAVEARAVPGSFGSMERPDQRRAVVLLTKPTAGHVGRVRKRRTALVVGRLKVGVAAGGSS